MHERLDTHTWMTGMVYLIDVMFVSKDSETLNMPMGHFYAWLCMEAIVMIGTLCF